LAGSVADPAKHYRNMIVKDAAERQILAIPFSQFR
jgi:hypothetical protein